MRPRIPVIAGALAAFLVLGLSGGAAASNPSAERPDDALASEAEGADEPAPPAAFWPVLDTRPRFAAGLEGYAGIGAQWTSGDERAHGFLGVLARVRYGFFQVGGTYETTDAGQATALAEPVQEHWRSVGGFAGVWLPYRRWVDLEGAIGLASRRYVNPDPIYGANGLDASVTELTLRLGASDRMTSRLVGPRVGAALVIGVDLKRESPPWRREYLRSDGTVGATSGTTDMGGVSVGLVIALGFELGGGVFEPR